MQPNPFGPRLEFCKKLGLKDGHNLVLLDAPTFITEMKYLLFPLDVEIYEDLRDDVTPDIVICWASDSLDLAKAFELLRTRILIDGAVWMVIPKKPVADTRGPKVYFNQMLAAALPAGLVDNKTLTFSEDEYGIRS